VLMYFLQNRKYVLIISVISDLLKDCVVFWLIVSFLGVSE
jgi:hypothetical protein